MGDKVRRNNRRTNQTQTVDPYKNLVSDIIIDALLIISGQAVADDKKRREALDFIHSEKCKRWSEVLGINLMANLNHKDSKIKIEEIRNEL
jgi:hypothetical protein